MDVLGIWARNDFLPGVIVIIGGVLCARLAAWLLDSFQTDVDARLAEINGEHGSEARRLKRSRVVAEAFGWGVRAAIITVSSVYALSVMGMPLSTFVAPAAIIGAAIGFGAQQVVGDVLSGFFLIAERQFGYGDVVRFGPPGSTTGVTGTVEEVTLRVTKLRTDDGEQVIIRNGMLNQVTNLSNAWSRASIDVPIASDEDLGRAREVVETAARAVADDPQWAALLLSRPVLVGVEGVEVGYVRLRVAARTLPDHQFEVARELRLRIFQALKEHNVATLAEGTVVLQ